MKKEFTWVFVVMAVGGLLAPGLFHGASPTSESGLPKKAQPAGKKRTGTEPPDKKAQGPSPAELHLVEKLGELIPGRRASDTGLGLSAFLGQPSIESSVLKGPITSFVVTVPDPNITTLDSYFDQALDAVAHGVAANDCTTDRFWLPWHERNGETAEERLADAALKKMQGGTTAAIPDPSTTPGFLLFRCAPEGATKMKGVAPGGGPTPVLRRSCWSSSWLARHRPPGFTLRRWQMRFAFKRCYRALGARWLIRLLVRSRSSARSSRDPADRCGPHWRRQRPSARR
jgi:hypothetical protein